MIALTRELLIGNSYDEQHATLCINYKIKAILNVAYDMPRGQFSDEIEYMHVGLIDGPGNIQANYCAAVLAVASLIDRCKNVLICCPNGNSRSVAVVVMYLILKAGRVSNHPTILNHWLTWDQVLNDLRFQTDRDLPEPHWSHKEAADKLPYGILEQLL